MQSNEKINGDVGDIKYSYFIVLFELFVGIYAYLLTDHYLASLLIIVAGVLHLFQTIFEHRFARV